MYRDFFVRSPLLALPVAAMGLFLVVFLGVVARAFSRRRGADYALAASLPLTDDSSTGAP